MGKHEESLARVQLARVRAMRAVNAELIRAYWHIGKEILRWQEQEGNRRERSGPKIVPRLSADLQATFPDMRGLSAANLNRMRRFAAEWPEEEMLSHGVTKLPWGHIVVLLNGLDDRTTRDWYAARADRWTRDELEHHVATRLHEREASSGLS